MPDAEPLSIGLCAQLACILEATARKPGNVHRYADFGDTTYLDFLLSAAAIGPVMDRAPGRSVGETVLEAVKATRRVVSANTNLGIILLLAPLASVPLEQDPLEGVRSVLGGTTVEDARQVYEAIRLAKAAGLGKVGEQDVAEEPTLPLREVMVLAYDRDAIAREYACGFRILAGGVSTLETHYQTTKKLERSILLCYMALLSAEPDSLIARKCGPELAAAVTRRALDVGYPIQGSDFQHLAEFDAWLRADGNRRNPGTTADLVTACLFVALRRGIIQLPLPLPFASDFPPG
jgi:triphosphoribosyl-dephospho-CoA synthase